MLMAHNSKYYWDGYTMQIRSTARTVTIMYICHMQPRVHYTDNTDAITVM